MNLLERIAEMAHDNAITPDPVEFRALKRRAKETMRLQSDWGFTAKGNMVVVTCKGNDRGRSVAAPSGVVATRVLLAALDIYDQEVQRLATIKESHARVSGRLQPLQESPATQVLSGRNKR